MEQNFAKLEESRQEYAKEFSPEQMEIMGRLENSARDLKKKYEAERDEYSNDPKNHYSENDKEFKIIKDKEGESAAHVFTWKYIKDPKGIYRNLRQKAEATESIFGQDFSGMSQIKRSHVARMIGLEKLNVTSFKPEEGRKEWELTLNRWNKTTETTEGGQETHREIEEDEYNEEVQALKNHFAVIKEIENRAGVKFSEVFS